MNEVIFEMAEKMEKSIETFRHEISKVRTGGPPLPFSTIYPLMPMAAFFLLIRLVH